MTLLLFVVIIVCFGVYLFCVKYLLRLHGLFVWQIIWRCALKIIICYVLQVA